MMHLSLRAIVLALLCGLVSGCTTVTTVQVQRVLGTPAKLQEDSPAGRQAQTALQALIDFRRDEVALRDNCVAIYARQTNSLTLHKVRSGAASESNSGRWPVPSIQIEKAEALLTGKAMLLGDLNGHIAHIEAQICIFTNFFTTNEAVGLGPRITWEVMKTSFMLDKEKEWLVNKFNSGAITNFVVEGWNDQGGKGTENLADVEDLLEDLDRISDAANQGIANVVTTSQGFGDFETIGVAEIDLSDAEYRKIFNSAIIQVSPDSISMSSSDITGDANVIIVQESPGQFRTYQISNDPTTLTKNISLLVSKATAAAAKYLSGGIAP